MFDIKIIRLKPGDPVPKKPSAKGTPVSEEELRKLLGAPEELEAAAERARKHMAKKD